MEVMEFSPHSVVTPRNNREEEELDGLLPAPSAWFDTSGNMSIPSTSSNSNATSCRGVDTNPQHHAFDYQKDEGNSSDTNKMHTTTTHDNLQESSQCHDSFSNEQVANPVMNDDDSTVTKPMIFTRTTEDHFLFDSTLESADHSNHCASQQNQNRLRRQREQTVGAPLPSPSWQEISSKVLPAAARELLSTSVRRFCHSARLSYALTTEWRQEYQELGNPTRGYFRNVSSTDDDLPPFSSLPWIERQMVQEWRTFVNNGRGDTKTTSSSHCEGEHPRALQTKQEQSIRNDNNNMTDSSSTHSLSSCDDEEDEDEFVRARTLVPRPKLRPKWQHAETCHCCYKPFGPTRLRHHCRLCGNSFCQAHSSDSHPLPHLGYRVPERVCNSCKTRLLEHDLSERVSWRLARCRDLTEDALCPYFDLGVDTMHDMAVRLTKAAIAMAKSIPLGAQATVAVETIEVLRRYGLNGIYTILLRQEFLAAADMLRKALGIDDRSWPLSVHELSAAIFYALAQHRALRGLHPEREHEIHALRRTSEPDSPEMPQSCTNMLLEPKEDESSCTSFTVTVSSSSDNGLEQSPGNDHHAPQISAEDTSHEITPVCEPLPDSVLNSLIFYAPLALSFIYAEKEVDMQLLAAQQGWRLLYAYLQQKEPRQDSSTLMNRPSSAVFVHEKHRVACLAVRGTATIHDVITDIRQVPVPFPEPEMYKVSSEDWTTMTDAQGLAVSGMVAAALNLYREHVDSLLYLALEGYRIRLVGHSLGGAVATLIGVLLRRDFPALKEATSLDEKTRTKNKDDRSLRVYSYGTPACVDARLSDNVQDFVVSAVLHDDAVPRLSPASCRGLLKHLLHIRDTWVKEHLPNDLMAITERAKQVWAPRWREGFTLLSTPSSSSIKRYCRKQYNSGRKKFFSIKDKLLKVADGQYGPSTKVDEEKRRHEDRQIERISSGPSIKGSQSPLECGSASGEDHATLSHPESRLLVDFMGGIDHQTSGIVIDGDEFFEANGESLVEDERFEDAVDDLARQQEKEKSFFHREQKQLSNTGTSAMESRSSDTENPGMVVLDETPLPRLYVPGKVVHIYSHRGVYRAVYVPRSFRELCHISLAGNMLTDHKCKSYYEALLEVRTVRLAPEDPPRWTAFDEDTTCSCCASRFTWASTSSSKAQEARDKHNCRSCGTLVCDPCSSNRVPLPSLGLSCPVRVCDRCYHNIDRIVADSNDTGDESLVSLNKREFDTHTNKPERVRERRSQVVDELSSRITAPGYL